MHSDNNLIGFEPAFNNRFIDEEYYKESDTNQVNHDVIYNNGFQASSKKCQDQSYNMCLTDNFNFFAQMGAGYRSLPQNAENTNQNLIIDEVILSQGKEFRNETFFNITLGTDYHINAFNVFGRCVLFARFTA